MLKSGVKIGIINTQIYRRQILQVQFMEQVVSFVVEMVGERKVTVKIPLDQIIYFPSYMLQLIET